ncbi:MAG: arylamine N-acetyltransferase, partial [Oscillospiraceae bacterium]|nr:arylamine N-acetyltransferase [Oscillospiraceae bacterium]
MRHNRGGYCFELNSLFCAFLRAVGFEAYVVTVRIVAGRDFVTPPAHCAVICVIDGEKYFS